jgi:hypothetical protein
MHKLFMATVSEETHRAFLLNFQLFTILRLEDQGPEEALTSKQGTRSQSADTAYPLPQILAIFGAGRSIFAFMIPVLILQTACLAHFFLVAPRASITDIAYPLSQILTVFGAGRSTFSFLISLQYSYYIMI